MEAMLRFVVSGSARLLTEIEINLERVSENRPSCARDREWYVEGH